MPDMQGGAALGRCVESSQRGGLEAEINWLNERRDVFAGICVNGKTYHRVI